MSYTECERFDGIIKDVFYQCADRDSELFVSIDTSGIPDNPRLERRILKLIKLCERVGTDLNAYKRKLKLRFVAIIAAVLSIMIMTLSIAADHNGMTTEEYIRSNLGKIISLMKTGEVIKVEGLTVIKNGKSVKYNSIEEAMAQGGFAAPYPTVLPEGVELTVIERLDMGTEGKYMLMFRTDSNVYIMAQNYSVSEEAMHDGQEVYEVNGHTFFITQVERSGVGVNYYAGCLENGVEYVLECKNKEDLILMIENTKFPS